MIQFTVKYSNLAKKHACEAVLNLLASCCYRKRIEMYLYLGFLFLVIGVCLYILLRSREAVPRGGGKATPGFDPRRSAADRGMLEQIKSSLRIDAPIESKQVHIMFVETTGISEARVRLRVSNPTPHKVIVERVNWELWLGKLIKSASFASPVELPPHSHGKEIVFQEVLADQEAALAARGQQGLDVNCYLEGICFCKTDFGNFEKKFVSFKVSYEIIGRMALRQNEPANDIHADSLTGLLQRRFLEDHLQSIIDATVGRHPLSFVMIDVDHFKQINDRYGHPVGDEILKTVCAQIKDIIGDKGLAVRYGGDEFSIVLEYYESHEAELLAQRLLSAVEQYHFNVPGGDLKITLSIGVATLRQPMDFRILIKKADDMLLRSKKDGRNRVTVDRMDRRRA